MGWRAHECMYAWVYLTDYLAIRKIEDVWRSEYQERSTDPLFPTLDAELWERHDRAIIDPHFQINRNSFETAAVGAAILSTVNESQITASELGSTFFTAIDKFRLASLELSRLEPAAPEINPEWYGIDNSPFVNDVARILHSSGVTLKILDDHRKARRVGGYGLFLSRFVSSYVFDNTLEFSNFLLANYDGGIVEDAFSAAGKEVEVFNHGQRETYFDLAALCRKLQSNGRRVFMLDHFPDFPAGTKPCFVCKLVFVDHKTDIDVVSRRVRALGYELDADTQEVEAETVLERLKASTTAARWEQVSRYKMKEPVWGRTPAKPPTDSLRSRIINGLYRLRRSHQIKRQGWRLLNLSNPLTIVDVEQALSDKKNG